MSLKGVRVSVSIDHSEHLEGVVFRLCIEGGPILAIMMTACIATLTGWIVMIPSLRGCERSIQ